MQSALACFMGGTRPTYGTPDVAEQHVIDGDGVPWRAYAELSDDR